MDTETQFQEPQASGWVNKRTITLVVVIIIIAVGVFFGMKYLQYAGYLKTIKSDISPQSTNSLSPEDQKDLEELDRLRAEYKATMGSSTTTATSVSVKESIEIKSLDALRKKATSVKQTTAVAVSEEQQLKELDAMRAQAQATTQ